MGELDGLPQSTTGYYICFPWDQEEAWDFSPGTFSCRAEAMKG